MIPHTEMTEQITTREPGRLYIDELSKVVNRKPDTIRKWERAEMLPPHLMPKRGTRDWRYWTDKQVYGPRGILKWMKDNNIRPGAYLTSADGEASHIEHMRRPRGIKQDVIDEIRYMATTYKSGSKKGMHRRSRKWIVHHFLPRTTYSSEANFEKAIVAHFAAQGWEFPPAARNPRAASGRMTKAQMAKHPEVRRLTREANRIVRIVDKKLTTKGK